MMVLLTADPEGEKVAVRAHLVAQIYGAFREGPDKQRTSMTGIYLSGGKHLYVKESVEKVARAVNLALQAMPAAPLDLRTSSSPIEQPSAEDSSMIPGLMFGMVIGASMAGS